MFIELIAWHPITQTAEKHIESSTFVLQTTVSIRKERIVCNFFQVGAVVLILTDISATFINLFLTR